MQVEIGDTIQWRTDGTDPITLQGEVRDKLLWPFTKSLRAYVVKPDCTAMIAAIVPAVNIISVVRADEEAAG